MAKDIKKICLITQSFYPQKGGISSYLMGVYNKYLQDVEFEVIVPKNIGTATEFNKLPFKVHPTDFSPFTINDSCRNTCNKEILSKLNEIKPDMILFGYIRSHIEVGIMYKKIHPEVRIALFAHAKEVFIDNCIVEKNNVNGAHTGYSKEEIQFYKDNINSMNKIFAVSNFTKDLLIKQGITAEIVILYPPIKKINQVSNAKCSLGLDEKSLVLLSVGRLIKRKGQNKVIRILPKLKRIYPNIKYLIVGGGPELDYLQKQVKDLLLTDTVSIYTSVEDDRISSFYSACDLFVLPCSFIPPNDVEGFCIVFLEAGSARKPCIGGRTGGIPEAILDKKTGFLISPESEDELLFKIDLLLKDKVLRNRFGKEGQRIWKKNSEGTKSHFLLDQFN